ncbi:dTDP-4-dehydrorhamnose 3,5-epimerase [Algoriphagus halophytocola]|uniref:dTDP-4-dehydrorhamnose 3,5-epimerase n=1 Tax=Algoriphagus halophytocola TaxID=2991499 RepID=A0ABY6MJA3_9BACT|nr:dTDP-4-dehydrorhamnose 3,5-epimerase [Algoriphagus sp. TR-M5]UZD23871.1 dTDP-4-dehydrorhamnose 3,5-epimerase [Algoriphagus sp. TR-M5]
MKLIKTPIKDLVIIEPRAFGDERGYFMESFKSEWFYKNVNPKPLIQDNESKSTKGVLRGLHLQAPPFTQAKLVRVVQGEVLDVAVDLRKNSVTFGNHFSIILSADNKKQFYVPRGFAHGFAVLSDEAVFSYKVDNVYAPDYEMGLRWDDPVLGIDWQLGREEVQVSSKDAVLPIFNEFESPFTT